MLKAIKNSETVVDLTKPEGTDPDGGGNGGGNGTSETPGISGTGSGTYLTSQYTISVTSANTAQGTVTGGSTYSEGSRVNISATPKAGFLFEKWSDVNTQATRTIQVNLSLTASFKAVEQ